MNPRSEPLLWVQLISLGALPLELLLLVLLLAGADPGPLPQLERLLAWALGALAPALLLWRRPANLRSLLLLSAGPAEPTLQHLTLARLQSEPIPRLLFAAGVIALLPLLGWLDHTAALASGWSPLEGTGRLSGLLLAAAVLALMTWQWQQLVQALWLLSRTTEQLAAVAPLSAAELRSTRSNPGLPVLHLSPLALVEQPRATARPEETTSFPQQDQAQSPSDDSASPVAVDPEQAPEEDQRDELDQQIG